MSDDSQSTQKYIKLVQQKKYVTYTILGSGGPCPLEFSIIGVPKPRNPSAAPQNCNRFPLEVPCTPGHHYGRHITLPRSKHRNSRGWGKVDHNWISRFRGLQRGLMVIGNLPIPILGKILS